jgi:phosphatidylinositol glycan class V
VGNYFIPDHSADAFNPPRIRSNIDYARTNTILEYLLSGLANWDAKHFLHVSQYNYVYEHSAAFFPLLPFTIRYFKAYVLDSMFTCDDYLGYLASGALLNFIFFNISAIYLVKLTLTLFNNNKTIAAYTLLFYCVNPASIFFSAVYSECMYMMISIASMYYLYSNRIIASICLTFLSGLARSNGFLNAGFVAYVLLANFFSGSPSSKFRSNARLNGFLKQVLSFIVNNLTKFILLVAKLLLTLIVLFIPFASYQYYIYARFCRKNSTPEDLKSIPSELVEFAHENKYRLFFDSDNTAQWCERDWPISYASIQAEYWKVGFFAYWQVRQIPNFLLASPIIFLGCISLRDYFASMPNSQRLYDLFGLVDTDSKYAKRVTNSFKTNKSLFPFALHLAALMISSVFVMHVQVKLIFFSIRIVYIRLFN